LRYMGDFYVWMDVTLYVVFTLHVFE
jgi:hypothetical protein